MALYAMPRCLRNSLRSSNSARNLTQLGHIGDLIGFQFAESFHQHGALSSQIPLGVNMQRDSPDIFTVMAVID